VRTRTPVVVVPMRTKARTIDPPVTPPPADSTTTDGFEPDFTPVDDLLEHIAERGAVVTRDLRLAVEELSQHTRRSEQRSANRILALHSSMARTGAPAPPSRTAKFIGIAKWLGPLLVAIAGAIYAAGVRQGSSESAAAERAADRSRLEEAIGAIRRLELDVSNLRGAMRALREDR